MSRDSYRLLNACNDSWFLSFAFQLRFSRDGFNYALIFLQVADETLHVQSRDLTFTLHACQGWSYYRTIFFRKSNKLIMIESSLRPFLNKLLYIHHSNTHPTPPSTLKVRAYQRETKSRREEKRFGGLILICDTPRTKLSGSNESSLRLFLNIYYFIFIIRILYRLQHWNVRDVSMTEPRLTLRIITKK